jgi:hypothetical protein
LKKVSCPGKREWNGRKKSWPQNQVRRSSMSFKGKVVLIVLVFAACIKTWAQELYILNEPASSVPKGVVGLRAFSQNYKEYNTTRSLHALRLMYGATAKLSLMATASFSNHHDRKLPKDLINHTHIGNQTNHYTAAIKRGVEYPLLFNGVYLFAKYRFLTRDQQHQHFRMAAYADWSNVGVAHDEAEPNLMDDTGGYGFGIISTWLKNRFAASLTAGFIKPEAYSEMQRDMTGGPDLPTTIQYGNAIRYNLSLGYRLLPKKYEGYEQVNWNVYIELIGKTYDAASVVQNGAEITAQTSALKKGSYVEIYPGIQRILNSNTRIEFCYGFELIGYSYVHFTPVWTVAIQRYFYNKSKRKQD